jgi:hypothetical protein
MEKKFEEKFGLKAEEMSEILGGLVSPTDTIVSSKCALCTTCVMCKSSCTYCSSCVMCKSVAFVGVATPTGDNISASSVYHIDTDASLKYTGDRLASFGG